QHGAALERFAKEIEGFAHSQSLSERNLSRGAAVNRDGWQVGGGVKGSARHPRGASAVLVLVAITFVGSIVPGKTPGGSPRSCHTYHRSTQNASDRRVATTNGD